MATPLYFEDVKAGMQIPPGAILCDTVSQVKWASANKDYSRYHYDKEYAISIKLPDAIVNGRYKLAQIAQTLTNWAGFNALRKITLQYKGVDIVGEKMTFGGKVIRCMQTDGKYLVECEVWAQSAKGQITTQGTAILSLPPKKG